MPNSVMLVIWMVCVIILQIALLVMEWRNETRLTRLEKKPKTPFLLPAKLNKTKVIPYVRPIRKNK